MELLERRFIYKPIGDLDWSRSHAQVPFAYELDNKMIRIFYSTRDAKSRSCTSFIDVSREQPDNILYQHNKPVLVMGEQGSFDDSGAMPSWFLRHKNEIWMYYTGWNSSPTASYRLSIGLAISKDDGLTFTKVFNGPILDRSKFDPIWVGQPCVIRMSDNDWRMWYLCCEKVVLIDDHPEPFYNVKYATSKNGIDWDCNNIVCIDFDGETDAIGRPCVWIENGIFNMLHSNRKASGYRMNKDNAYKIVYSNSLDGLTWSKSNDIVFEKPQTGWDSIMNEYCSVYKSQDNLFVIYNGNGFGESGFGYAKFEI